MCRITHINDNQVTVVTEYGMFTGTWCDVKPPMLKKYYLELDVPDIISLADVRLPNEQRFAVCDGTQCIYITGLVVHVEEDLLFLQFGDGIIMLNKDSNSDFATYLDQYVVITVSQLYVYDTGIV